MGCNLGFWDATVWCSPSCESMAPTPYADVSVWRKNGLLKLG